MGDEQIVYEDNPQRLVEKLRLRRSAQEDLSRAENAAKEDQSRAENAAKEVLSRGENMAFCYNNGDKSSISFKISFCTEKIAEIIVFSKTEDNILTSEKKLVHFDKCVALNELTADGIQNTSSNLKVTDDLINEIAKSRDKIHFFPWRFFPGEDPPHPHHTIWVDTRA